MANFLKNSVFLELKRRGYELFYYKDKKECDFLVFDRDRAMQAIQVCYDISDKETREREIAGLLEACKALGISGGVIVTLDEDDEIVVDGVKIELVSAYKYLLK